MRPTIVTDYKPESFLVHWLVLEKECPLDVVADSIAQGIETATPPYYQDGDVLIYDLSTLVQFLQERYPGEQLLPADPVSRAQIRQACKLMGDPELDLMDEIETILLTGSQFMAGREFTLLDIYVGTWLSSREKMPAAVFDYWRRISNRPAFIKASQC